MRVDARQPIAQIGQEPPTKKTKVGFTVVTEKLPPQPYARKFVTSSGNVVRVVLGGRTELPGPNNPYGQVKYAEKLALGWLPYSECPIGRHVHIDGEVPCAGPDSSRPGMFGKPHPSHRAVLVEDECCPHIQQAIAERQTAHNERQAEYATQFQTSTDKLVRRLEQSAAEEVEVGAENVFAQTKGKRK